MKLPITLAMVFIWAMGLVSIGVILGGMTARKFGIMF